MNINDWIYISDFHTDCRYVLGTTGKNPLIVIGINPSTAEPEHPDNTVKSVINISQYNGFDSFLMLNIYAQRATNPDHLDHSINLPMHHENIRQIQNLLRNYVSPLHVWAAWGTCIDLRPYLKGCLNNIVSLFSGYNCTWYHAGPLSKAGHPHHPLYLSKSTTFQPFDIDAYLLSE